MKLTFLAVIAATFAIAQDGTPVNPSGGPPPTAHQMVPTFSGTNVTYMCYARSNQQVERTLTVSAASNASPVSFTSTHGFDYQSGATTTPVVKITGATASWSGLNGVWAATPTSSTTFTIAVDSSAFGTYTGQTPTFTTLAPSLTALVWSIRKFVYDGSSNMIWSGWGSNPGGAGATRIVAGDSQEGRLACASKTTYSYQ